MKCKFCNEEMQTCLDDYWLCVNDNCKHKNLEPPQRYGVRTRQYMVKK